MRQRLGFGVASALLTTAVIAVACSANPTAAPGELVRVQSALTSVVVTVKDTNNAAQVGVTVTAQKSGTNAGSATTNSQGKATFALASGTYKFLTAGQGTGFNFSSANCTTPGCTTASITTTIPVVVTVADSSAVPQANLEVLVVDTNGNYTNSGWTDANGHVSLSANTGSYRFATPGDGQGFMFYNASTTNCTIPGCTTASITWTHPVAVTVVDTNGAPQPDFEVLAQDSGGNYVNLDYTDSSGAVSLSVPVGTYHFVIPGDGTLFSSAACTVAGCTSATITLPIPVDVTVLDALGHPIANQTVLAQDANGNVEASVDTDANGVAEFSLAFGAHRFEAQIGGVYYTSGALGSCVVSGCTTALIQVSPCTGQANGTACNDGNACTQTDTCQNGACVGSNPVTCTAQDQCHDVGTCNTSTGVCSNPAKANGTTCNDGNACTQTDTCQSGACTGSNPVTCTAQDQCHDVGTCNTSTGVCSNPNKANGTACNDGNACTQTDTCQAGACTGSNPVTCVAQDQCHDAGTCNTSTGTCSNPNKANGTACNDGNACTQTDTCQSGACTGSNPVTCVAQDQCHDVGTCNASTGACSNPNKANGTTCNDGNACTQTDTCQSGSCTGSNPVTCVAQDQCHNAGTCNTSTGICSNPPKTDGTACDDGNNCTSGDSCLAGSCNPGAPSCASIAIEETSGSVSTLPQMSSTLSSDATTVVPGDIVNFTSQVTNTGSLVDLFFGTFTVRNNGSSTFTVGGYQQTLEYYSVSQHTWVPFAKLAYDAQGNPVSDPNLFALQWVFVEPNAQSGATFAQAVPGTTIAAGGYATWDFRLSPVLPADVVQIIFNPAEASSLRAAIHFDVPSGAAPSPGTADLTAALSGATGEIDNTAVRVFVRSLATINDTTGTALSSTGSGPLAPGATRIFTGAVPATAFPARDPGDTDAVYLSKLTNQQLFGYDPYSLPSGRTVAGTDLPPTSASTHFGIQLPIVTPTKSGPPASNAGLTLEYNVALANSGAAVAGPFTMTDTVGGNAVPGAVTSTPPTVAAGATGTGTIDAPTALGQAAGPMTDTVAVTWQDKNGNGYGPVSSSFTTNLAAGHPEGYLSLSGATNYPDLTGSTKTLTATALDPYGSPAAGVAIHVAVTGVNPTTTDLTTGANGTVTFSYAGTNLGHDTIVASGTITTTQVQTPPATVEWASSVGTPCTGRGTPLDVALVIDGSPSMLDDGKLSGAKAASDKFIDDLDFTRDQVAGIVFSGGASLAQQLTTDGATAKTNLNATIDAYAAACSGICAGGTNVPLALDAAIAELTSARHRSAATPVVVFLSDGGNTGADPTPEITQLRTLGVHATTIGLGSDVDIPELLQIASSRNDYFYAPAARELDWVYNNLNQDLCRNHEPLVAAGGNQGFYEVRLPDLLTLSGEVHDDGPAGDSRFTSEWTLVSGPAPVAFTDATSPATQVLFSTPGTYVLQLAATDGYLTVADRATVTVDPDPSIVGANLLVALGAPGPLVTGTNEGITTTLTDGLGAAIANFPIKLTIAGANAAIAEAVTNSAGIATFSHVGTRGGTDVIHATALGATFQLDSASVTLQWTEPSTGGPVATQGWIAAPLTQTSVTGQVPIKLSNSITLASGTLTYWPASAPTQVHTLATNLAGSPGATLATFDTTALANGSYTLLLTGTDDAGNQKSSAVMVTATGDYKPGRLVTEVTDFTLPIAGLPITVGRRYDSLEKDNVGDFGHGWSLALGHPKLEVDPAMNVSITMPDNRRVAFYFVPTFPTAGPVILGFFLVPGYQPEPGVFGTLTSDGCSVLAFNPFADLTTPRCLSGILDPTQVQYAPTTYTYTDPYGRQFTMAATGELKSIKDRTGNTLTFAPNGILSSTGKSVAFERDSQGRITTVTSPAFGGNNHVVYAYVYNAAGDLDHVDMPPSDGLSATAHYTYSPDHRLLTTVDPRGNPGRTSTYDTNGRLATDTDALGNVTHYAYDLGAHATTITNPDNGVVTQVFDDRGLLLSETDPLGRTTTHEYDANRNETKRTNALGEATITTYDDHGSPTSVRDSVGRTTYTTYDPYENPTTFKDALGHVTTVDYDERGVPTRLVDELGTRFTFTSSEQGVPLTIDDAAGNRAYLTYDDAGNVTSRTDWLGRVTKMTYDELGRKLTETSPRGGVSNFAYTARGRVYAQNDPATSVAGYRTFTHDQNDNVTVDAWPLGGHTTTYTYDALNHLTLVTHGDDTTRTYTRDFRGNVLTETDEASRTTTYEYDLAGQLKKTTFPDGTFTTRTYDALGRLAALTDERSNTTTYEYDAGCGCAERVTKTTDPLGRSTTTGYDGLGRRTYVKDAANNQTSFAYDVRNHLLTTTYPDGSSVSNLYDSRGRRTNTTDQTHVTTQFGYDDQGQLTSVIDALEHVTSYAYDLDGNLSSVTDANSHTTTYEYDLANRNVRRTLPLGQSEVFAYDIVGNQTSHMDFRGKTTTMTYDVLNRLLTKAPDASLGEMTRTYVYNPTGTRASMTDPSGATTLTYDSRDRLLTKAGPAGTLTYTYDASGNVATMRSSNANGTSVDYAWDAANQLASVTDNRAAGVTTAAYTPTGRRDTMSLPNGVGATYAYDSLDRAMSLSWRVGAGSPFASWAYTFNDRGQRLTATDVTGRAVAYGYDAVSRLNSETVTNDPRGAIGNGGLAYTLDPVGNRLTRASTLSALGAQTFAYDANDELSTDSYDANGNTIASGGNTYAYDFENRLISKSGPGGMVSITYDADGNRVGKTADGVTTKYLVDNVNPSGYLQVLEEVSGGSVDSRYTYGSTLVSQTRNVSSMPTTSYYGYDAHGDVTFLTDANGVVTDSYDYDASGNVIAQSGSTPNARRYGGEELDPDLELLNTRARLYNPGNGRFLTIDPLPGRPLRPGTFNRYLYADADPENLADHLGLAEGVVYGNLVKAVAGTLLLTAATITLGRNGQAVQVTASMPFALGNRVACNMLTSQDKISDYFMPYQYRFCPVDFCEEKFKQCDSGTASWSRLAECSSCKVECEANGGRWPQRCPDQPPPDPCEPSWERCLASPLGGMIEDTGKSRCAACRLLCEGLDYWPPRLPNGNACLPGADAN